MTTITEPTDYFYTAEEPPTKKKGKREPKAVATSVLNVNVIPNKTRHYSVLESASEKAREAAATEKGQVARKLNLVSEQNFIKEMEAKGIEVYSGLEDPLDDKEKSILHDNFRREGAVRRATVLKAQFILGERTKIVLDTNRVYATQEREDAELERLNNTPEYLDVLEDMMNIDEEVNLYQMLKDILIAGENYGRAVLVKQYDKDGIPIRLIPLWSVRLGKVYVNAESHELLGVEYLDYEGEDRILRAEDIIYFVVDDYPITPNSRWYGLPPNEVSMATSLSNRITMETAINEIVTRHWANARVIKAPGIQGQARLNEFASKLLPGKDIVTNQENISVENISLDVDVMKVLESVTEREKKIFRDQTVPQVIGFQDEQNRATAYAALHQWTESVLKDRRTDLRNIIEEQWYQPSLKALLKRRQAKLDQDTAYQLTDIPPSNSGTILTRQELPLEPPLSDELVPPAQEPARPVPSPLDPNDPPFRFKMTFEEIIFDTFLEKAAAVLGYKEAGVISDEIAMDVGGFSQEDIEKMRVEKQEQAEKAQAVKTTTPPVGSEMLGVGQQGGQEEAKPGVATMPIAARSAGSSYNIPNPKGMKPYRMPRQPTRVKVTDTGDPFNPKVELVENDKPRKKWRHLHPHFNSEIDKEFRRKNEKKE